ncbi:unnamed protein product, partial [Callosobruchus maculatus]
LVSTIVVAERQVDFQYHQEPGVPFTTRVVPSVLLCAFTVPLLFFLDTLFPSGTPGHSQSHVPQLLLRLQLVLRIEWDADTNKGGHIGRHLSSS